MGSRPPAGPPATRRPGPPPAAGPGSADPTEDDDRPVAGRRGDPGQGPDKRLVWGAVGAGVLIVLVIVIFQVAKKKDPETPAKADPGKSAAKQTLNFDTPEGRAEFERLLMTAPPEKVTNIIGSMGAEAAVKVKDILIPFMLRQDAGRGMTDAWNIAERLAGLKDERVLKKIIELGLVKPSIGVLLKTYGAMGSQAVIDAAKADPSKLDAYYKLLVCCVQDDAAGPMVAAAETCEVPEVAWMCGDALYNRNPRTPVKLERVQAWLAGESLRGRASGIRQMALQKGADRDAALAPFATTEAPLELKCALLDVLAEIRDLSREHMRNLLAIEDLEVFEECMKRISERKLFEYIPELKKIGESAGTQRGRRASAAVTQLEFIQQGMKK